MQLDYNTYKNSAYPSKAIIFIHGWGGNKDSFLPFAKKLKFNSKIQWFLPQAPYELDNGRVNKFKNDALRKSWTYKKSNNQWEIKEPINMLNDFFLNVVFKDFKPIDVYVFGFSQGAAVCYEFIMGMPKRLGGIFPIAGFLFENSSNNRVSRHNLKTPIIIGHGVNDDVVSIEKSEEAYLKLVEENANVIFEKYNGGHKISLNYLNKIIKVIDE